ncbi:hypothetical protein L1278_002221 [Pontibacter sp. HSC-36F09]|nr:hypothetical protein [Pontibacter sp. HSC-36F09]
MARASTLVTGIGIACFVANAFAGIRTYVVL